MKNHFAWSIRRELWEHRAVWIAPLVTAGFTLLAFVIGLSSFKEKIRLIGSMDADKQVQMVVMPYNMAASVILLMSFIVACFFCLDALNAERRDRSILFWKSMPVSDATTVLSKFAVAVALIPAIAFGVAIATQFVLLMLSTIALSMSSVHAGPILTQLPYVQITITLLYGVVVHALWYAPLYAALLLISLLARRAPFLWATAPLAVAILLERIAFGTSFLFQLLRYRIAGAMGEAFVPGADKGYITTVSQLDPVRFLTSPGLWLGLVFAAACLALAIYLRRSREPI